VGNVEAVLLRADGAGQAQCRAPDSAQRIGRLSTAETCDASTLHCARRFAGFRHRGIALDSLKVWLAAIRR